MAIEIKVPGVGESVQEAILAKWYKKDGDRVSKDEPLFVLETDKVTLEIEAEADGYLKIEVAEGETVRVGKTVGRIETEETGKKPEKEAAPPEAPPEEPVLYPSVRRLVDENALDPSAIEGTGPGGRITKPDVILHLEEEGERKRPEKREETAPPKAPEKTEAREAEKPKPPAREKRPAGEDEPVTRKAMSPIRRRIAERLLAAKQNTAMLTTFNEIDMSRVQEIRSLYKDAFLEKHGVALGIMSFFIKASVAALREIPEINARIERDEIVYHHYHHIGVAVGSPRGLVVPVIRHADRLGFAELEQAIVDFVKKIRENRLEISDLEKGTFTISNGGIYGSLLSTPILNMPQSGILGMHKIEKRPVVVEDAVVIRPMMYVALSYDHRIVDGREAVTFLKRIKECVENPERIMVEV